MIKWTINKDKPFNYLLKSHQMIQNINKIIKLFIIINPKDINQSSRKIYKFAIKACIGSTQNNRTFI